MHTGRKSDEFQAAGFFFSLSLEHNPKVFDKKYYCQEVLTIIIYACK